MTRLTRYLACLILAQLLLTAGSVAIEPSDELIRNDQPLTEPLVLPEWFKVSFLELKEDIAEARTNKRGLIIYYGQEYCPYCRAHLRNNWGAKDIVKYTRDNFDVIAINVRGDRIVSDFDGHQYNEKIFSKRQKATFTPTLVFYDKSGEPALKLVGYREPYHFRAALEYVADNHHKKESFRYYLARAEGAESFGQDSLNESAIFRKPPYQLPKLVGSRPLAVFFEKSRCHACDVLHAGPLGQDMIQKQFASLNSVQLDMWSDTPVTTPDGRQTTAKQWADKLDLNYAPTIIFFAKGGQEIIRIDSVVGVLRLGKVLNYINSGAYREQPDYESWRTETRSPATQP